MMTVCFRPFDLKKWFVLGFSAWLASLGEGGGGGNFSMPSGDSSGGSGEFGELESMFDDAVRWVEANVSLIVAIAAISVLALFALGLLFTWVKSRSEFVFIDGVVKNRGAFREPWGAYAVPGNSLFWTRTVVDFGFFGVLFVLGGLMALMGWQLHKSGAGAEALPMGMLCLALPVIFVLAMGYSFFLVLLRDIVVPVMYARNITFRRAWANLKVRVFPGNWGTLVLYFLMKFALGIGIGIVVLVATLMTCCIAALPYIGSVILLPVAVFVRAYGLYFVEQFGQEYAIFGGSGLETPDDDLGPGVCRVP
jgi:hypothetical protein